MPRKKPSVAVVATGTQVAPDNPVDLRPEYKAARMRRKAFIRKIATDKRTIPEIRQAVAEDLQLGYSFREVLEKEGLNPWELKRIFGYLKGMRHRANMIGSEAHIKEVVEDAWLGVQAACNSNAEFNRGKSGATVLKGLGIFKSGDTPPQVPQGGTIIENAQIFIGMSPEDQEKIREHYRKKALTGGSTDTGDDGGRGASGRLQLATERDKDGAIILDAGVDPHEE